MPMFIVFQTCCPKVIKEGLYCFTNPQLGLISSYAPDFMSYNTPLRLMLLISCLLTAVIGCGESGSVDKVSKSSQPETVSHQQIPAQSSVTGFGSFDFVVPHGWNTETLDSGILLTAPDVEVNWQANIFLELGSDSHGHTLEEVMADLVPNLKANKGGFKEVSRRVWKHPEGFEIGVIQYTSNNEGTPLTEQEIIIDGKDNQRLFVLTSAASATWGKYQPIFDKFIASLTNVGP